MTSWHQSLTMMGIMGREAEGFILRSLLSLTLSDLNFSLLSFPPGSIPPNKFWMFVAAAANRISTVRH